MLPMVMGAGETGGGDRVVYAGWCCLSASLSAQAETSDLSLVAVSSPVARVIKTHARGPPRARNHEIFTSTSFACSPGCGSTWRIS